jgi:hypothetical protein
MYSILWMTYPGNDESICPDPEGTVESFRFREAKEAAG